MDQLLVSLQEPLGILGAAAAGAFLGWQGHKAHARIGLRIELRTTALPSLQRALDTPEAKVDYKAMHELSAGMVEKSRLLSRREQALSKIIRDLEHERWRLIGPGFGTGAKAMPEFHLKNEIRDAILSLSEEVSKRLPRHPQRFRFSR